MIKTTLTLLVFLVITFVTGGPSFANEFFEPSDYDLRNTEQERANIERYLYKKLTAVRAFDQVIQTKKLMTYIFGTIELELDKLTPYQVDYIRATLVIGKVVIYGHRFNVQGVEWRILGGLNYPRFAESMDPGLFNIQKHGNKSFFTEEYISLKRWKYEFANELEKNRRNLSRLETNYLFQEVMSSDKKISACSKLF